MHTLISRSHPIAGIAPCRQQTRTQHKQQCRDVCVSATSNWQGDLAFKRLMVLPGGAWFMSSDAQPDAPVYGDSFIMQGRHAAAGPQGSRAMNTGALCTQTTEALTGTQQRERNVDNNSPINSRWLGVHSLHLYFYMLCAPSGGHPSVQIGSVRTATHVGS